jgi:hypothetical protein
MYFVTMKRDGYVLFCTTPSERAAIGLTERQGVHLLVREAVGASWLVLREWSGAEYSHTEFMSALQNVAEPGDPRELVRYLPARLRS